MMCLTSADALSRYAFNSPILGAFEITEKYLMVAAIFMGLSYGYRGGLFIRVTFLVDRLSGTRAARGRLFRLPGLAGVLRCLPVGDRASRRWRGAARRHRAQHAADPGRAGLLPRADRLSRADRAACSSICRACGAASRCCSRKRRPPPPERTRPRKIAMVAALPMLVLLLCLLAGVPIAVALAGSGMFGIWLITGDFAKVHQHRRPGAVQLGRGLRSSPPSRCSS